MVPPMMAQLLFDDILYGQVAREEHRRFQQLIRYVAEEVIDTQDLLEEVLESDKTRKVIVRDIAARNGLGRKLVKWLLDQPPAQLAEILVSGIPNEKESSGQLPKFDLFPVPNFFFARDPQVVIGDRVVISSMATQARRREALLAQYVFQYHKRFRGTDPFWLNFMENEPERPMPRNPPTLEGGDILVASDKVILVGLSERTNRAGVMQLAKSLRTAKSDIETMIVVELPRQRSFMHLDTVFTFTSRNECLIYPPVILPGGSECAKITTLDLTRKTFGITEQKSLLSALKKVGFDLEPISCGGSVRSISSASSGPTARMRLRSHRESSFSTSATCARLRNWRPTTITSSTRTTSSSVAWNWSSGPTRSTRFRSRATSFLARAADRAA
jgi:arginine deiminase